MKAVVKVKPEPNGTELKEVETPKIGPEDVLIKVKAASICGSDVHIYNWNNFAARRMKLPQIYGHEFCGEVVEVGNKVTNLKAGDFVSGECHLTCGHCIQCRSGMAHICQNVKIFGFDAPGAFAEYAVLPATNAWKNDPDLPPKIASIQDPLGNAVHSVTSADIKGKDVAIIGVGPIGAMCIALCKHFGAGRIMAIEKDNGYRLHMARKVGATHTLNSDPDLVKNIMEETGGKGADVVLEMSGNPKALTTSFEMMAFGGSMIILGIYSQPVTLDFSEQVVMKYATIKGITGRRMFEDWKRVKELLKDAAIRTDLETIITHKFPLEKFHEAMEMMKSGRSGKIVFEIG